MALDSRQRSFLIFDLRQRLMWIPWVLALLDSLLTYLAGTSGDGLAMLIPYFAAYPFGILLERVSKWIGYSLIMTNPYNAPAQEFLLWNRVELTIFIIGGALWFFFIGLIVRWLLLRAINGLTHRKHSIDPV